MKVRIDRIFHIVIGLCAFREVQVRVEAAVGVQPQYVRYANRPYEQLRTVQFIKHSETTRHESEK
jgi:hypothetical protein